MSFDASLLPRLLQQIALKREAREKLEKESIAWPLLAKTVLIQTQYPELYQLWRQFPTLVQTLEEKYDRRQTGDKTPGPERAATQGDYDNIRELDLGNATN